MNADQHSDQAMTYMQQGQFELARSELQVALAIDPRHPVAHYNRAMLFRRQGNWQGVSEALRTHLQIVPNDVEAHNNLGLAYRILGQLACPASSC
jgi:Tfp pilus assembly protein PilF